MSSFSETAKLLTPEIYSNFKEAVETGKWPDGRALTQEQKTLVMEAVILYESAKLPEEQRTGYNPDVCRSNVSAVDSDQEGDLVRFDDSRQDDAKPPPTRH